MSKRGKAVICEVCPDRIRHQGTIIVGRKASGLARVIHDKPSCRKKWAEEKHRIMERWPESRDSIVLAGEMPEASLEPTPRDRRAFLIPADVVRSGKFFSRPGGLSQADIDRARIGVIEMPREEVQQKFVLDGSEQSTATGEVAEGKDMNTLSVVPGVAVRTEPPKSRTIFAYKPELDARIIEFLKTHEYRRGVSIRLWAVLEAEKSPLLIDAKGQPLNYPVFQVRVGQMWRVMQHKPEALAPATASPPFDESVRTALRLAREQSEALALGQRLCDKVWEWVVAGNLEDLRDVCEMIFDDEKKK